MRRCLPHFHFVSLLAILLAPMGSARAHADDFEAHWQGQVVRLQGWPASVRTQGAMLVFDTERRSSCQMRYNEGPCGGHLPPVLYLLDRDAPADFSPSSSHSWAVLDVRALLTSGKATSGSPNPEQVPFHDAVLTAVRALDVLLGQQDSRRNHAGLVGEGYGGALALALAALRPDGVAFVCAHEPLDPFVADPGPRRRGRHLAGQWDRQALAAAEFTSLLRFAPLVQAPTLLTVGEDDQTATPDAVQGIREALRCPVELVAMRRARHCLPRDLREWQDLWRVWTRTALGYE